MIVNIGCETSAIPTDSTMIEWGVPLLIDVQGPWQRSMTSPSRSRTAWRSSRREQAGFGADIQPLV